MITAQIKTLAAAKAKVAQLEANIAKELNRELGGLPAKFGFSGVDAFIAAVRDAAGRRRGPKPGRAKSVPAKKTSRRRKRAVITDETRASVKKMVSEKKTGPEIAKALGISLPSVQNIKRDLGMMKRRKK